MAQDSSRLQIRNLRGPSERKIAYDWAMTEGWLPGKYDHLIGDAIDPDGWFCGEIDGQTVSVVCGLRLSNTHGFVGLYICNKEFRGKGLAFPLFQHAMHFLNHGKPGVCIALDAVEEQVPKYIKSGFNPVYKTLRFSAPLFKFNEFEVSGGRGMNKGEGKEGPSNLSTTHVIRVINNKSTPDSSDFSRADNMRLIEDAIEFDLGIDLPSRADFLRAWMTMPESRSAVCYSKQVGDVDETMNGLVVVRPALSANGRSSAFRIAPLLAADVETAKFLMTWALEQALTAVGTGGGEGVAREGCVEKIETTGGTHICIDVIDRNKEFLGYLEMLGFVRSFCCIRMYTSREPEGLRTDRIFGASSLETQIT